jgi:hypothetical protein
MADERSDASKDNPLYTGQQSLAPIQCRLQRPRVPNGEIYLHQFLPILAHIIPPHLLDASRLKSLPRN